jgi:hypothetical protein
MVLELAVSNETVLEARDLEKAYRGGTKALNSIAPAVLDFL